MRSHEPLHSNEPQARIVSNKKEQHADVFEGKCMDVLYGLGRINEKNSVRLNSAIDILTACIFR